MCESESEWERVRLSVCVGVWVCLYVWVWVSVSVYVHVCMCMHQHPSIYPTLYHQSIQPNITSTCIHMSLYERQIKKKLFGTKSPNLGKGEFLAKIGRRHFFLLIVPYLHPKFQKDSWTSFPENRVTNKLKWRIWHGKESYKHYLSLYCFFSRKLGFFGIFTPNSL